MGEGKARLFDRLAPPAYLLVSAIFLYPLSTRFWEVLPGPRVDSWQNLWNFWWVRRAFLTGGGNPFWTGDLFHPVGADLSYHTLSLLNTVWAVPLGGILSPVALMNLLSFLTYPIGAWGAYLLAREFGAGRGGSFLAGVFYAFFPNHVDHLYAHLNLTSQHLLPFFLLFTVRLIREPRWRTAAAAGGILALQTYASWTYAVHGLMVAFLLFLGGLLFPRIAGPRRAWLPKLAAAVALFFLLIAPILVPPLRSSANRGEFVYKGIRPDLYISVETMITPSIFHPVLGEWIREVRPRHENLPRGTTAYLGAGALLFAIAGIRRGKRETTFLAGGAALFLVLAMGPHFQLRLASTPGFPLPYRIIEEIPLLRFLRVPNRFLIPYSLLLAPLVALGFSRLWDRKGTRPAAVLLALLLLFEFFPAPLSVATIGRPPFCERIAQRGSSGAVLDIPLLVGPSACFYMYYQTIHERPIVSGYVSITPPEVSASLERIPILVWASKTEQPKRMDRISIDNPVGELNNLGVGDVVLHRDFTGGVKPPSPPGMDWAEGSDAARWYRMMANVSTRVSEDRMRFYRKTLEEWLGPPYYEDDRVALFAVPDK